MQTKWEIFKKSQPHFVHLPQGPECEVGVVDDSVTTVKTFKLLLLRFLSPMATSLSAVSAHGNLNQTRAGLLKKNMSFIT